MFLRVLEYYDGLLFLTTNRPGVLDEAFKSRIHLTLYYPPLDFSQTMEIWQLNVNRLRIVERERCREVEEKYQNGIAASSSVSNEIQPSHQLLMQINEQDILRFAEDKFNQNGGGAGWNGRQIRNAFQIASSLAHFDARRYNTRPRLTVDHFKMIHLVTEDFDRFMQEAAGKTDAEHAFERGDRADHWRPDPDHARNQALLQSSYSRDPPAPPHSPGPQRYTQEIGLGLGQRNSLSGGKRPVSPLHVHQPEPSGLFNLRRPSPNPGQRPSLTVQSPTISFNSGPPVSIEREHSPRRESNDFDGDDGYHRGDIDFSAQERTNSGSWVGRKRGRQASDPEPPDRRWKRRDYNDQDPLS